MQVGVDGGTWFALSAETMEGKKCYEESSNIELLQNAATKAAI
jgi:hypothetical protein